MANRRMFSLNVINTDNFLEMPSSAQCLYFHLGMRADDDGFVASPKMIAKIANCSADDLKILISKGYIIPFQEGIIVITHWKQSNSVPKDRYKPTIYQEQLAQLTIKEGNVYSLYTECLQDGNSLYTQVSIGKDNINNICASEPDARKSDFEKIYAIYPKKKGKQRAFGLYCQWLKGKVVNGERIKLTNKQMYIAVRNYVTQQQQEGTDMQYWKNFDTLMGQSLLDYVEEDTRDE